LHVSIFLLFATGVTQVNRSAVYVTVKLGSCI